MIYEVSTLSARGQVTIPKPIRQALGVDTGARLAFEVLDDRRVVVTAARAADAVSAGGALSDEAAVDDEPYDPALGPFLGLLDKDIDADRVGPMPPDLEASMLRRRGHPIDLDEVLIGEVALG